MRISLLFYSDENNHGQNKQHSLGWKAETREKKVGTISVRQDKVQLTNQSRGRDRTNCLWETDSVMGTEIERGECFLQSEKRTVGLNLAM